MPALSRRWRWKWGGVGQAFLGFCLSLPGRYFQLSIMGSLPGMFMPFLGMLNGFVVIAGLVYLIHSLSHDPLTISSLLLLAL